MTEMIRWKDDTWTALKRLIRNQRALTRTKMTDSDEYEEHKIVDPDKLPQYHLSGLCQRWSELEDSSQRQQTVPFFGKFACEPSFMYVKTDTNCVRKLVGIGNSNSKESGTWARAWQGSILPKDDTLYLNTNRNKFLMCGHKILEKINLNQSAPLK